MIAIKILHLLEREYGNAPLPLKHKNVLELLIAVMLSAQTTDLRVNAVTPKLFKKYKTARDFAQANLRDLEKIIYQTGFYRQKAKNIKGIGEILVRNFAGKVPKTMDDLLTLPGVARKTANIVLADGFGIVEGIAVDTHVKRVAKRLGLTTHTDPKKIEQDLMKFPHRYWRNMSLNIILHGRKVCSARKPNCAGCLLNNYCRSAFKV